MGQREATLMGQSAPAGALRLPALNAQVIETDRFGNRWMIAAFELREDAEAYASAKRAINASASYDVHDSDPPASGDRVAARTLRLLLRQRSTRTD